MAAFKGWRVWAGIAVIFLSGVMTGVLAVAAYIDHRVNDVRDQGPQAFEGMVVHLLDWHLDLDRSQEESILQIIGDVHLGLLRFKTEHQAEIETIVHGGLERIEATLTENQKPDWSVARERIEAHLRTVIPNDPNR